MFGGDTSSSISQLKDVTVPEKQIDVLNEICTMLCIGMEDYIRGFDLSSYLPAFIHILSLSDQCHDEVLILTCRALALILDVVPQSCNVVVSQGAVPLLLKLLEKQASTTRSQSPIDTQTPATTTTATIPTNPLIEEILKSLDKVALQEPNVLLEDRSFISTLLTQYETFSEPLRNLSLDIIGNLARKCTCNKNDLLASIDNQTERDAKRKRRTSTYAPSVVDFEKLVVHVPQLAKMSLHIISDSELEKICKIFAYLIDRCHQSQSYPHFQQLINTQENQSTSSSSSSSNITVGGSLWEPLLMRLYKANTKFKTRNMIIKVLISFAKFNADHGGDASLCNAMTQYGLVQVLKMLLTPQEEILKSVGAASSGGDNVLSNANQLLLDVSYLITLLCPPILSPNVVRFTMEGQHEWSWEDDFHNFHAYDKVSASEMEKAYSRSEREVMVQIRGNNYRIDLVNMKQYNMSTQVMRNVSRSPIAKSYRKVHSVEKSSSSANTPSSPSSMQSDDTTSDQDQKKKRGNIFLRVFKKQKTSVPNSPTSPSTSSPTPTLTTSSSSETQFSELPDDFFNMLTQPLIQLASTSANESIRESAVVNLVQIITHTRLAVVMGNDLIKNSLSKFLHRAIRKSGTNSTIISHAIYLADYLLLKHEEEPDNSSSNFIHLFIRENLLAEIELVHSSNKGGLIRRITQNFIETYSKALSQQLVASHQYELLRNLCAQLQATNDIDFFILMEIFGSKREDSFGISIDQFNKSQFASFLWKFLKRNRGNVAKLHQIMHSLVAVFDKDRRTLSNLVDMFNSSLEILENFPSIASVDDDDDDMEDEQQESDNDGDVIMSESQEQSSTSANEVRLPGFNSTQDLRLIASSKISLNFKLKTDYDPILSDLTDTTFTLSPLASMRAVEQFIVDRCVANVQKRKVIRLDLYLDGQLIEDPYAMTLYETIRKYARSNNYGYSEAFDGSSTYTIQYTTKNNLNNRYPTNRCYTHQSCTMQALQQYYLNDADFSTLSGQADHLVVETLCILRLLHALNINWNLYLNNASASSGYEPLISSDHFINNQLTSKLTQQMVSPMTLALCCAGQLPAWNMATTVHCSFLYPFSTRHLFFNFIVSGAQRSIMSQYAPPQYLHVNHSINDEENRDTTNLIRKHAQRIKIMDRSNILVEARKELAERGINKTILEFEYDGEPGTGLGPTLQFYTSCSKELQLKSLDIWYDNGNSYSTLSDEGLEKQRQLYVNTNHGVFPNILASKLPQGEKMKRLSWFTMAGRLIAKSLEDGRICDINFSKPWLELILGKKQLELQDYNYIDPFTASSLKQLQTMLTQLKEAKDPSAVNKISSEIDNMMLSMNYRGMDLVPNGDQVDVTHNNYEQYVTLLQKLLFSDSYSEQLNAFCNGFHEIVNLNYLNMFSVDELKKLISGNDQLWTSREQVEDNITTSHGFTMDSQPVQYLINVVSELDPEDQRLFLEFSTGTTRLPVDGKLTPKLTISRKIITANEYSGSTQSGNKRRMTDDDSLITCNTCFHLIKLPNYSSQEILKKKLLLSIRHGRGAFELS